MADNLKGKRIAILAANGFEQSELEEPKAALEKAGAITEIISPEKNEVKGWKDKNWGDSFPIDVALDEADASQYDALLLPGGVMNPDTLRLNDTAVNFIRDFYRFDKPIAAICHGPWPLIDAQIVKGHTLTSWPSIKNDLLNAGATWIDQAVVRDKKLVTSRKPGDIPEFNSAMIELFAEELETAK